MPRTGGITHVDGLSLYISSVGDSVPMILAADRFHKSDHMPTLLHANSLYGHGRVLLDELHAYRLELYQEIFRAFAVFLSNNTKQSEKSLIRLYPYSYLPCLFSIKRQGRNLRSGRQSLRCEISVLRRRLSDILAPWRPPLPIMVFWLRIC